MIPMFKSFSFLELAGEIRHTALSLRLITPLLSIELATAVLERMKRDDEPPLDVEIILSRELHSCHTTTDHLVAVKMLMDNGVSIKLQSNLCISVLVIDFVRGWVFNETSLCRSASESPINALALTHSQVHYLSGQQTKRSNNYSSDGVEDDESYSLETTPLMVQDYQKWYCQANNLENHEYAARSFYIGNTLPNAKKMLN